MVWKNQGNWSWWFMCDASIPRRQWRKEIIGRVYEGGDGHVRRADVRLSDGITSAASKLAILDIDLGESM